jgi:hypothetical protein
MTDANERPLSVALENRLMGDGIYLERWDREGDDVTLEYETVSPTPAVTSQEVGAVVRTLLAVVDEREGWTPATVRATSTTTDGEVRGTWRVDAAWFDRLHDDLSEVEFSRRVLETVENRRSNG